MKPSTCRSCAFEVGFRGGARNKVLPEALMLTTDENIVDMQFVVQYRLRADGAPIICS